MVGGGDWVGTYHIGCASITPDLAPPQLCEDGQGRLRGSFTLVSQAAIKEVLQ